MYPTTTRRRARLAVAAVASLGLFGGVASVTTSPAVSAEPAGDCTEAFPVADLAADDAVTGLTVEKGTTPEAFTGTVLGVIKDGIAPGLDMIMAELDSPAIDRAGGIWQGMSGSPVYAADGRLIGAVAYGLSWGPSPVAGITPFEEMDNYLPDAPANRVKVSDATARRIAQSTDVSADQAEQGFAQLKMPFGVSGLTSARLAESKTFRKDHKYLPKNTYRTGAAAAPGDGAGPETIVAGGNLAVAMAYGDITIGGVGTATSICDGGVVGFGHPATFLGTTTMSMHPADAIYVQPESLGAPFKVANLGAPAGTITDDHLSGVSGAFGALPPTTSISSAVSFLDRSRTGETSVTVPEFNAAATFYQQVANHDRVIDGIIAGSELMNWTITGTDADGTPFTLTHEDRFASNYDITFESPWELADLVYFLSGFEGVTVEDVTVDGAVTDDSSTWMVERVEQKRGGEWVKVSRRLPAIAKAGKALVLRAVLEGQADATMTVPLSLDIPAKAGRRGFLEVSGGGWQWTNYWNAKDVDDIAEILAESVRNDAVAADLYLEDGRRPLRVEDRSEPTDKVVYGGKRVTVKVRH